MVTGLTMASSLVWMSIVPAAAVIAHSAPTVTPGSVHLTGPIRPTNGSATFTASASDPNGTAEYQFWVESPTGQWRDMQNYSTSNTFTLATPSQGDYLVVVDVMDQAQVAAGDWSQAQTTLPDGVFNGSTVSVASNASGSVSKGTPVTLTATSSGIFDPLYQFWYQDPSGTWHQSGAYQSSKTFTFTAGMSGTYKFVAFAKSPEAANNQHGALQSSVGTQVAYGTASQVVLTPASGSVVANGSATDMLTAKVEDSHGDVVANFNGMVNVSETVNAQGNGKLFPGSSNSGVIAIRNGTGLIPLGTSGDTSDGNAAYTLTSDNLMSAATSAGGTAGQGQVANVTYGSATVMTTAPSDNRLNLQSSLPNLESNQVSSATVWVQLEDSTGAPYTTTNGQLVHLTLGGTSRGSSFSASSSQTSASLQVPPGASQFPVTVYSAKGSAANGTITVQAQSGDQAETPLVPASISIPVYEVGTPAAVDVSQVGATVSNGTSLAVYQADVVDASGHTISVGPAAAGSMSVLDNSTTVNSSSHLDYYTESATSAGWHSGYLSGGIVSQPFSQGALDFGVRTVSSGNGQPVTITATDLTAGVSGSTLWHFAAPAAVLTETLPVYAGQPLASATVTAGGTATVSAQLADQYGHAMQEAGQPIWFTLKQSGIAALPNGASQSGDTYEAFTNSQGIASIPLTVLSGTAGDSFDVTTSALIGNNSTYATSPTYEVVSPSNYATSLTLTSGTAVETVITGSTLTVPAGMPLATVTGLLANALGGLTAGNNYDQLLFHSSNSGVVSVGRGTAAGASQLEEPSSIYQESAFTPGGTYTFGRGEHLRDGLYAGKAGTATITVTDVSNAAMPSASFTVKVVPGPALKTPWIEYQGQQVSASNPVSLTANSPVELQVVNVDQAGDPIPVPSTGSLSVTLPSLPSGEQWTSVSGGAAVTTVAIPASASSANVWMVSSASASVSTDSLGYDTAYYQATGITAAAGSGEGTGSETRGAVVSWSRPSAGAADVSAYQIWVIPYANGAPDFAQAYDAIPNESRSATSAAVTGLTETTQYAFNVDAVTQVGSNASAVVKGTPSSPAIHP